MKKTDYYTMLLHYTIILESSLKDIIDSIKCFFGKHDWSPYKFKYGTGRYCMRKGCDEVEKIHMTRV